MSRGECSWDNERPQTALPNDKVGCRHWNRMANQGPHSLRMPNHLNTGTLLQDQFCSPYPKIRTS
eukprot:1555068-Pleurochrysis_carterae.AAC.2